MTLHHAAPTFELNNKSYKGKLVLGSCTVSGMSLFCLHSNQTHPYKQPWHTTYIQTVTILLHLSFFNFLYCFIFCFLSRFGSRVQQLKQGNPDAPLPSHIHQLFQGDTEMFPSQPSNIITPACPGSTLGSPPRWACPKHLPRETYRRNPEQMPKQPQLASLNV